MNYGAARLNRLLRKERNLKKEGREVSLNQRTSSLAYHPEPFAL
jgi:hypothetical protein